VVTGVSRRAGIGYAIARRLAAMGASLVLHHYAPHDRDQPWGADPAGLEAVIGGVTEALAAPDAAVWHQEADLSDPDAPSRLIESAAATSRFLDILICNHARSGGDGPPGSPARSSTPKAASAAGTDRPEPERLRSLAGT
jgi:3-oxoacyl-[acyl-carrier protein] reductase